MEDSAAEEEATSGTCASGAVGPAPRPEPDVAVKSPEKQTNRNPVKWKLLQESDAVQVEQDTTERGELASVIDKNVAAGLYKLPVHKDRIDGLHVLTCDTSDNK